MHGNQLRNFSFSYHNTSFKIHIKYYTDIAVSFLLHSIKSLIFSEYDCSHARKLLWQECSLPLPRAGHLTSAKMIFVPSYSLFALKNDKIWSVNISGGGKPNENFSIAHQQKEREVDLHWILILHFLRAMNPGKVP